MPNLLERILGFPEGSSGRRPQMAEFTGINWNAPTAYNMLVCLPMWEPPGMPCLDQGPLGLIGAPNSVLRTQDAYFGDVYLGDGAARGYKIPYSKEINFGIGVRPFSLSFWYKAPVNFTPNPDCYLMTYDDPGQANFPGFAVSFDTLAVIAINTGNTTLPDAGFKSNGGVFDGQWHHCAFSHQPSGNPAVFQAVNTYYIDGRVNARSATCSDIGAVGPTVPLYIGTDDDGVSQPYGSGDVVHVPIGCYFCDFRIYRDAFSDDRAAAMYHPDTRWEIYTPARKRWFLMKSAAVTVTDYGLSAILAGEVHSGGDFVNQGLHQIETGVSA